MSPFIGNEYQSVPAADSIPKLRFAWTWSLPIFSRNWMSVI